MYLKGRQILNIILLGAITLGVVSCGGDEYTDGARPEPPVVVEKRGITDARFYAAYQTQDGAGNVDYLPMNVPLESNGTIQHSIRIAVTGDGVEYFNQDEGGINASSLNTSGGASAYTTVSTSLAPLTPNILYLPEGVTVYEGNRVSQTVEAVFDIAGKINIRSVPSSTNSTNSTTNINNINTDARYTLRVAGEGFVLQTYFNIQTKEDWRPVTAMAVQTLQGETVSGLSDGDAIPVIISKSAGEGSDELLNSGRFRVSYGTDANNVSPVTPSNPNVEIANTNPDSFTTSLMYEEGVGYTLNILASNVTQNATIQLKTAEKNAQGVSLVSQVFKVNTHYDLTYALPNQEQYFPAGAAAGSDAVFTFASRNLPADAVVKIEETTQGTNLFTIDTASSEGALVEDADKDGATITFTVKAASELVAGDTAALKATAYSSDGTTPLKNSKGAVLESTVAVEVLGVGVEQGAGSLASATDAATCGFDAYPVAIITGYKKEFKLETIVKSVTGVVVKSDAGGADNTYDTAVVGVRLTSNNMVTDTAADISASGALICLKDNVEGGKKLPTAGESVVGEALVAGVKQTLAGVTITPTVSISIGL